jgi:hypothetical protein
MREKRRRPDILMLIVVFSLVFLTVLTLMMFAPALGVRINGDCWRNWRTGENVCFNELRTAEITPPNGTPP